MGKVKDWGKDGLFRDNNTQEGQVDKLARSGAESPFGEDRGIRSPKNEWGSRSSLWMAALSKCFAFAIHVNKSWDNPRVNRLF
jgi:hypothetical protein